VLSGSARAGFRNDLEGRRAEELAEDTRRGRYLDAREALDYGLIDEITASR
jgi:ATP-dependent protease ClpP protease subunit